MVTREFKSHRFELAARISRLREEQHLSARKFSTMIGIHRNYLAKIEKAESCPTFDMLERIAAGLGVTVMDLVDFSDTASEVSAEYDGHQRTRGR